MNRKSCGALDIAATGALSGAAVEALEGLRAATPGAVDRAAALATDDAVSDFQRAALLVQLALVAGEDVQPLLSAQAPHVLAGLAAAGVGAPLRAGDDDLARVLRRTAAGKELGAPIIRRWVDALVEGQAGPVEAAVWLSTILAVGLRPDDTVALTLAMARSGRVYDYRTEPGLRGRTLVRRYPTGGLSEKLALVLPALLVLAARDLPVASPFLVARTLGFTGGTWDKLSSVPGFRFPEPGPESLRLLGTPGVCMTVTTGDLCPADRLLYRLRSLTGTVRQADLIVSSLASKQLAVPVHRCVLDVRHGSGAFLGTIAEAHAVAGRVRDVVARFSVELAPVYTAAEQPNGAAVGNALEVGEALAVLGLGPPGLWPGKGVEEQRILAGRMMKEMLEPSAPSRDWAAWTADQIGGDKLKDAYAALMTAHAVPGPTIRALLADPAQALNLPTPVSVLVSRPGRVQSIDSARLGNLVNFRLASGRPRLGGRVPDDAVLSGGPRDLTAGVSVLVRLGDEVKAGSPLCDVYSRYWNQADVQEAVASCFNIQESADI